MDFINLPRVRLAHLPTPLQELPRLTKALKGPRIYVKRDDLTGLALGGNKTRKLEYLMGDAIRQKADYIVTGAGFHSNWCTQTSAAARQLGVCEDPQETLGARDCLYQHPDNQCGRRGN
jgi:1-aminocyclopropane-1-carboxylate deaminase/D-cysteine desulfhydrase-like pyridoxal-dependent ACC family enzyme